MATICSIEGCDKPVVNVRGWCKAHYQRWYRHGDPLKRTRLASGEAEIYLREVVMAYNGNDCIFWPYSKGRAMMSRGGRHTTVSRIVCEEEHGSPPTPDHQAAHSCGKGHEGCVTKGHLSWKTAVGNAADKHLHGTMARGDSHGRVKLTEADVAAIRSLKGVETQMAIAQRFGVTNSTVSSIHRNRVWSWLQDSGD